MIFRIVARVGVCLLLGLSYPAQSIAAEVGASVQLLVHADEATHLARVLREVQRLKRRKVEVTSLQLATTKMPRFYKQETHRPQNPLEAVLGESARMLAAAELTDVEVQPLQLQLGDIHLRESPVWLVDDGARRYVFEGVVSISRLFSTDGELVTPPESVPTASFSAGAAAADAAIHVRRNSGHTFPQVSAASEALFSVRLGLNPWGSIAKRKRSIIDSTALARCRNSGTALLPLANGSSEADGIDVLFYDGNDPVQRAEAAKSSSRPVAYQAVLTTGDMQGTDAYSQVLARMLQIPCLPTRVRVLREQGRRGFEYRLGEAAWADNTSAGSARSQSEENLETEAAEEKEEEQDEAALLGRPAVVTKQRRQYDF